MAETIIYKRMHYRIYPNQTVESAFYRVLNICRELYNAGLQERKEAWSMHRKRISLYDQILQLSPLKQERPDLQDINAQTLQDVLKQVNDNMWRFFGRRHKGIKCGMPRFRTARNFTSFKYPQHGFKIVGKRLVLHKIGSVPIKLHRPLEGRVKTCTVWCKNGKWYAGFEVECPVSPLPVTHQSVGIDVGIAAFASLSNGVMVDNPRWLQTSRSHLRRQLRKVARRRKGSKRRQAAQRLVANTHRHIFNQRRDFQHKLSHSLVNQFDVIAVEHLNGIALAKGFLSKQIHDVAFRYFFDQLAYKAESAGRQFIKVDPRGTSQTCTCGATVKKDLSVRWHHCLVCGYQNHRDIVSAQVILQRAVGSTVQDVTHQITESVS